MIIDNVNLNLFRIFESVYRNGSMTKASKELFMTQSGISQNIKNLEEFLSLKLFDRIKQKALPTLKGHELYKNIRPHLYGIEDVLGQLTEQDQDLRGELSIGLPIEYGNNVILPILTKWGEINPHINYKIIYGHAIKMNTALLKGELDIAIVDFYGMDKQIKQEKLGEETLMLCGSPSYLEGKGPIKNDLKFFEKLDYIDYVDDAPILRQWFKHHFKTGQFLPQVRASLMNVQGISKMILDGLGLGILPLHVVHKLKKNGHKLYLFKGSGKPLHNAISLARLDKRSANPLVEQTVQYFFKCLRS